ncbi:MAG TPA: transcription antitermination factor NusB [Candidatus Kapabacteria bacterium]|nr:transcription antitermination factor NusB [Candidatus Kapabacteria bacterium]
MASYTRDQIEDVPILRIENEEIFDNDPERDKHLSRRRLARERVLQLIYSHLMNDRDTDELFFEMIQSDELLNEQAIEFARLLVRSYNVHKNELNDIISKHLAHWDVSRVALIDKILIQIGILEFKYFPDVPLKATINELIEIAKDFSTDESGKFINGILHAIKEDLNSAGESKKEGRGLIEQSL